MSSVEAKLSKLREERKARENARIEKLRELNLKKYNKADQPKTFIGKPPSTKPALTSNKTEQSKPGSTKSKNVAQLSRNSRPVTAPVPLVKSISREIPLKPKTALIKPNKSETQIAKMKPFYGEIKKNEGDTQSNIKPNASKTNVDKITGYSNVTHKPCVKESKMPKMSRKSLAAPSTVRQVLQPLARKSMLPTSISNPRKPNPNWESVFDRLYKPKVTQNHTNNTEKTKKVILRTSMKPVDTKPKSLPIRRSISAVYFKKINKTQLQNKFQNSLTCYLGSELQNCFHNWASIGDQLNDAHMKNIVEEDGPGEKIVSAIKSERKKVKFSTSILNQNTPKPEELQERLQKWLLKRGKSLESYHHLQCFGIHHLSQKQIAPLRFEDAQDFDDENKENIAVQSDSDNESYTENMNDRDHDFENKASFAADKWRRISIASSSLAELNDTTTSTLSPSSAVQSDELLLGALNDLTELIKVGFDWGQCARWLAAVRSRCPGAGCTAAYWECRAALEERRGNLPLSVHCWEEAIVNGTEQTVVEANLDQLLDKFMQLNISPNNKCKPVDPKLVDVKNVFKSTIIRFAVQQAKLRQTNATSPRFTVTPVRRSGRLSVHERSSVKRSPLRICASVRQAQRFADKAVFMPNPALVHTP